MLCPAYGPELYEEARPGRNLEARDDLNQKEEVKELRRQNTRASKTLANEMVNSAWKIHLAKSCGSSLVAMAAAEQQTSKLTGATRSLPVGG